MAEIKKPLVLKKPLVPPRFIFGFAEIKYGIHIKEHELLIDDATIEDVLARGMPTGVPPMLEDLAERKKAFIDHFKRQQAGMHLALAPLREKAGQENARISESAEAVYNIFRSSIAKAEAGSRSSIAKAETGSVVA